MHILDIEVIKDLVLNSMLIVWNCIRRQSESVGRCVCVCGQVPCKGYLKWYLIFIKIRCISKNFQILETAKQIHRVV